MVTKYYTDTKRLQENTEPYSYKGAAKGLMCHLQKLNESLDNQTFYQEPNCRYCS